MHVENGIFLGSEAGEGLAAGDAALDKKLKASLAPVVSDTPFSGFVLAFIGDELSRAFEYQSETNRTGLTALPGFDEPRSAAIRIIDAFASLPWRYKFICPFPLKAAHTDGKPEGDMEFVLGDGVTLVRAGPEFNQRYPAVAPPNTLRALLVGRQSGVPQGEWQRENLYLVYEGVGFLTKSFSTPLGTDANLIVRSVSGLLEATGLTTYTYQVAGYRELWGKVDSWIYAFRDDGARWEFARSLRLDDEHADRLHALQWDDPAKEVTPERWDVWIRIALKHLVGQAFGPNDHASLLRRCAQWHFDSQCGSNELLQFVQAMVAVEILLGDKASSDVIGLGELLANRCAYSLARNAVERTQLLKDLKEIYSTRSQIVHRGKAILSDTETQQLRQLRWLGRRLIVNELEMMRGKRK